MFSILEQTTGQQLIDNSMAGYNQYEEMTKFVPSSTICPICGLPAQMKPRSIKKYIKAFKCLGDHNFYYDENGNICRGDGYNIEGKFIADNPNLKPIEKEIYYGN